MPAARYWRIARIETFAGGDLELSEVALYEGAARVDGSATVSSVVAPASGSLTDLGDASFSTSVRWPGDAVRLPGFAVVWDFGAGITKDISELRFAGPDAGRFVLGFTIEQSSDGAEWAKRGTYFGLPYAGADAFTPLVMVSEVNIDAFDLIVNAEGATLEEATANRSRESVTFSPDNATIAASGASVDDTRAKFGTRSLLFNGTSDYQSMKADVLLRGVGTTGDFCIAAWVRPASTSGLRCIWTFGEVSSYRFRINAGAVDFERASGGVLSSAALTWDTETFYQMVVERYNGQISVYRNGARIIGPTADATNASVAGLFHLARNPNSSGLWYFSGNMDALTVSRIAQFKGEFTPPATAPDEWPSNLLPYRNVLRTSAAHPTLIGEEVIGLTQSAISTPTSPIDIYDAGRGRITGTVKERAYPADIPVKRRVALLSMPGSRAIRETWSDSVTGEYEFAEIAMDRTYTVVSYDHTGTYMGEVADNVQPTLMA